VFSLVGRRCGNHQIPYSLECDDGPQGWGMSELVDQCSLGASFREKGGEKSGEDVKKSFRRGGRVAIVARPRFEEIFVLWPARAITWCRPLVCSCSGCWVPTKRSPSMTLYMEWHCDVGPNLHFAYDDQTLSLSPVSNGVVLWACGHSGRHLPGTCALYGDAVGVLGCR